MKYKLKSYYSETYIALDEINKYLNREVIRKEILKEQLLSELSLSKWKPSDEMINIAVDFTKNALKRNQGLEYVLGHSYRGGIDSSSIVGAYADSVLSNKTPPEALSNIKEFLKKRKFNLDRDSNVDVSLPIVSKQDIKNLQMILKTIDYLRKYNDPRVKEYLDKNNLNINKIKGNNVLSAIKRGLTKVSNNLERASDIKKEFSPEKSPALNSGYGLDGRTSLQSPYINMRSYLKDKGTLGHELTHALSGNETIADIGGALYYLGLPKNISDKNAISAARSNYRGLNLFKRKLGNNWYYLKNKLINKFKSKNDKLYTSKDETDIDLALASLWKKSEDIAEFMNTHNITDKEAIDNSFKMLDDIQEKIRILSSAKPIRTVKGERVYRPEVIDILYNGKDNGWLTDKYRSTHPNNITRANEVLHGLRPDLFTRDGIDKRTGKPVDFSLKGQILQTLKRAKTVGKRQFKVSVGRLKKSLGKIFSSKNKKSKSIKSQKVSPAIAGI